VGAPGRADLRESRRRVKVIGRLPGERSCLSLVWAVLDRASRGWHGLIMTPKGSRLLQDLRRQLLQLPAAKEVIGQAVTAAA
jgi:putative transposase